MEDTYDYRKTYWVRCWNNPFRYRDGNRKLYCKKDGRKLHGNKEDIGKCRHHSGGSKVND